MNWYNSYSSAYLVSKLVAQKRPMVGLCPDISLFGCNILFCHHCSHRSFFYSYSLFLITNCFYVMCGFDTYDSLDDFFENKKEQDRHRITCSRS